MHKIWTLLSAAMLALATGSGAKAEQAHVSAGVDGGQAVLLNYGGACFALTPFHVMEAGGYFATLTRRFQGLVTGDATLIRNLGHDLSLVGVDGSLAERCGIPFEPSADIGGLIEAGGGSVRMRYVFEDGNAIFRPAEIISFDATHLAIRESGDWTISPGHSGSALMVGDRIVGLVLNQGQPGQPAAALRWDFAMHLANWEMRRGGPEPTPPPVPGRQDADSESNGGVTLESPNTRAHSRETGPHVLSAPLEESGAWRAEVVEWPAIVIVTMPHGEVATLTGLRFHGLPDEVDLHPRQVEIQRTRSADGDRAWSAYSTVLLNPTAVNEIDFPAPMQARRLRLRIHNAWGRGDEIGLRRIEVVAED